MEKNVWKDKIAYTVVLAIQAHLAVENSDIRTRTVCKITKTLTAVFISHISTDLTTSARLLEKHFNKVWRKRRLKKCNIVKLPKKGDLLMYRIWGRESSRDACPSFSSFLSTGWWELSDISQEGSCGHWRSGGGLRLRFAVTHSEGYSGKQDQAVVELKIRRGCRMCGGEQACTQLLKWKSLNKICLKFCYVHQKPEEPTKRSVAVSEVSRDDAFVEFSGNKESRTKKLAQTTSRRRFNREDGAGWATYGQDQVLTCCPQLTPPGGRKRGRPLSSWQLSKRIYKWLARPGRKSAARQDQYGWIRFLGAICFFWGKED